MSGDLDRLRAALGPGPWPAADVMACALYDPVHGYYRRGSGPWGFAGKDYYTALDLGPLLGEALAVRLEAAWARLGRPEVFTVLEPGAGRGWLGRDLLAAATGEFAKALRYLHRDDNPAARKAAAEALAPWLAEGRAAFLAEAEPIQPFTGAVVSNELFDALPAQPWKWDGTRWTREVLTEAGPEWRPFDHAESAAWFEAHSDGLEPADGSVWCEALPAVASELCGALQRGLFLAIDYGDRADRLLAKGADLRRYQGHTVDGAWWEELGSCDLTADVDFTRLQAAVEGCGLAETGHRSLSAWIRDHAPLAEWEAAWQALEPAVRMKRMENLLQLTMPGMLGERFRVLEGWKG
ncbi:MAG: SAM-dependent methyltransferase [Holophagaceae bacterium]